MLLKICSVRDRATDQFGTPMFMVSVGQACRAFSDEINRADKENQLYLHPEDFDLYELGEFDTHLGKFEVHPPEQVAVGKTVAVHAGELKLRSVN